MKISVITVNYNNRAGLQATIESVLSQTYADVEFLVIDGGSTDGSADVVRQYADRIDFWVSEPDSGIYNAMNKGIRHATGDYLNFMNSGDCFYDEGVLQRVADYGADEDFIVGRDYHFDASRQLGHASIQPDRLSMATFFVSTLDHQSSFIRRSLFADMLYREDYRLVSDWIFYIEKIVRGDSTVRFIPDIVCRREEGGLSEQQSRLNREEISRYLHELLPPGVYADYAALSQFDKTTLFRLFRISQHPAMRRALTLCVKVINRIYKNRP